MYHQAEGELGYLPNKSCSIAGFWWDCSWFFRASAFHWNSSLFWRFCLDQDWIVMCNLHVVTIVFFPTALFCFGYLLAQVPWAFNSEAVNGFSSQTPLQRPLLSQATRSLYLQHLDKPWCQSSWAETIDSRGLRKHRKVELSSVEPQREKMLWLLAGYLKEITCRDVGEYEYDE